MKKSFGLDEPDIFEPAKLAPHCPYAHEGLGHGSARSFSCQAFLRRAVLLIRVLGVTEFCHHALQQGLITCKRSRSSFTGTSESESAGLAERRLYDFVAHA
jgi:hypothetical protein